MIIKIPKPIEGLRVLCHKISKYIDYPNIKELFLSLRH